MVLPESGNVCSHRHLAAISATKVIMGSELWKTAHKLGARKRALLSHIQGPTGSCFQLRDGSGSGIGKNFGFGFGYGSGSGISTAFLSIGYYRVLKILIGYFSVTSLIRYFRLVQLRS